MDPEPLNNRTQTNLESFRNLYFDEKAYLRAIRNFDARTFITVPYTPRPTPADFLQYRPPTGSLSLRPINNQNKCDNTS
jgi:hypothetical protein